MTLETWTLIPCVPKVAQREAVAAERDGWTGVLLADSQNLAAELAVEMAMCVQATSTLKVSPGVTNPVTRHPALLAGAMATLQAESGGRVSIDIGRGDSSLAHIGLAPLPVGRFDAYVAALRGFLRGEEVEFDPAFAPVGAKSLENLAFSSAPKTSSLRWLRPELQPVPVFVAASGPKVLALGATRSDGISLSIGADAERLKTAIDTAKEARSQAGLDPEALVVGAYINIAVHDDINVAADLVSGKLASFSRFSVMHGQVTGFAEGADKAELEAFNGQYDMNSHGSNDAGHARSLSLEFAQRNAVIGTAEQVLERLYTLRELGISRFLLTEDFARTGAAGESHQAVVESVLPEMRKWS